MLESITLKNIASYPLTEGVVVKPLKRVNLFYGLNGTGKSTIGNFLQSRHDLEYLDCHIHPKDSSAQIFVYNHSFLEKNFHEDTQPGIFTLNEGNIEAEAGIRADQEKYDTINATKEEKTKEGLALTKSKEKEEELLKDALWAIKKNHDEGSLKFCLEGFNKDKNKLKDQLLKTRIPQSPTRSIEALTKEADEISSSSTTLLPDLPNIAFPAISIETNQIFQEIISASNESYLSQLIQTLGNSDWVKESLQYLEHTEGKCPLCQQRLPHDFESEARRLFDKTYETKIAELNSLQKSYETTSRAILELLESETFRSSTIQTVPAFIEQKAVFSNILADNNRAISIKLSAPTKQVNLQPSDNALQALRTTISQHQESINQHNARIANKDNLLKAIKSEFWVALRIQCNELITKHTTAITDLDTQLAAKREEVVGLNNDLRNLLSSIATHRSKITNIETSIGNINKAVASIGLAGFSIEKVPDDSTRYRLVRPTNSNNVFKSLSEGEKTLITFLYFLEFCIGSTDANSAAILNNRIVVIDDPISSLSHNYIYEIAALIHHKIIQPPTKFKQIFILTHNLFFFHEMLKTAQRGETNDYQYFRITKGTHSKISPMRANDVQNDYQSFWQVIKDARTGRTNPAVLPNMMRNILEYYFSFTLKQDKLYSALSDLELEDAEFKPLYRYINRESHSDSINITDFGEINPEHLIQRFQLVFERSGFPEHYQKMMADEGK